MFSPFVWTTGLATGDLTVDLAPFVPANIIVAPSRSTHFKIISGGAEINFEAETFVVTTSETDILPWDSNETVAINHVNPVTPGRTKPLFLALGIDFFKR